VTRLLAATFGVAFLFGFAAAPTRAQTAPPVPAPVADSLLADTRGMADVRVVGQTTTVTSTSTVEGNTINGDFTTGTITLGNGALDNFNGLALFNINTGNNVAINSAMTVNVAIQP
jgi:hypothetical protein